MRAVSGASLSDHNYYKCKWRIFKQVLKNKRPNYVDAQISSKVEFVKHDELRLERSELKRAERRCDPNEITVKAEYRRLVRRKKEEHLMERFEVLDRSDNMSEIFKKARGATLLPPPRLLEDARTIVTIVLCSLAKE
ncbi:hypothetical protein FOZ60_012436 [Perkinsus olseni]|uniref:Uncharacterized protein n=1 Tax=Perkinsus olseni TaxID=32597 RepID=A0A7J6NBH4_PEROL|nr:hypothetical protein FOZ60_012436 [Perkinsus olseni]